MRYPLQANNTGGWTLDYKFLEKVAEMTRERVEEYCQMEQVEIALLCAEEVMKEKESSEIDRLRKALEFFMDEDNYLPTFYESPTGTMFSAVEKEGRKRASQALEPAKGEDNQ